MVFVIQKFVIIYYCYNNNNIKNSIQDKNKYYFFPFFICFTFKFLPI